MSAPAGARSVRDGEEGLHHRDFGEVGALHDAALPGPRLRGRRRLSARERRQARRFRRAGAALPGAHRRPRGGRARGRWLRRRADGLGAVGRERLQLGYRRRRAGPRRAGRAAGLLVRLAHQPRRQGRLRPRLPHDAGLFRAAGAAAALRRRRRSGSRMRPHLRERPRLDGRARLGPRRGRERGLAGLERPRRRRRAREQPHPPRRLRALHGPRPRRRRAAAASARDRELPRGVGVGAAAPARRAAGRETRAQGSARTVCVCSPGEAAISASA